MPLTKLSGTIQNDVLKSTSRAAPTSTRHGRRSASSPTSSLSANASRPTGTPFRSAATTFVRRARRPFRKLPGTLANGIAYVQAAIDAGSTSTSSASACRSSTHKQLPRGDRQVPAARRLWAHIMRDRFGATHPRVQQLRFHTQTAGSLTLTGAATRVNIAGGGGAMAAVYGTQSLHCNGLDEALDCHRGRRTPCAAHAASHRVAETGVANTVDPVGGSYVIEEKTDTIEREAAALIARLDAAGGTLAAIEAGIIQRDVQESAYRAQTSIDSGETVSWRQPLHHRRDAHRRLPCRSRTSNASRSSAHSLRASRDHATWQQAIDQVTAAAQNGSNVMPRHRRRGGSESDGRRSLRRHATRVRRTSRNHDRLRSDAPCRQTATAPARRPRSDHHDCPAWRPRRTGRGRGQPLRPCWRNARPGRRVRQRQSMTALSVARLLPESAQISHGQILLSAATRAR